MSVKVETRNIFIKKCWRTRKSSLLQVGVVYFLLWKFCDSKIFQGFALLFAPTLLFVATIELSVIFAADYKQHYFPFEIFRINFRLLTGSPGSGKSTQCRKIAYSFGYAHISKDLVLREIEAGTERGLKIIEILKNKESVPDVRFSSEEWINNGERII